MFPVSKKLQRKIKKHLEEWNEFWSGYILVQRIDNIDAILNNDPITRLEAIEIEKGWPVTKLVDPWYWLHWVGYDAHEAIRF